MVEYYDVILGLIPVLVTSLIGATMIIGAPLSNAILLSGIMSVLLIGHALFVNSPVHIYQQYQAQDSGLPSEA
ncbi:MAG: hypothetical protein ABEI06_08275 [Halobacteriaceae archaeon]